MPGQPAPQTQHHDATGRTQVNTITTLGEALAARQDSQRAINFIDGENNERRQPFSGLFARAAGVLKHFQDCGAAPRDEMIIIVERNEQFIDAFWAGVLGNIILVPVAPSSTDEHRAKLFRILAKLQRPCLCTDAATLARLKNYAAANGFSAEIAKLESRTVLLDRINDISIPGQLASASPDDIALDRKSTRLNSSHTDISRMPSSA